MYVRFIVHIDAAGWGGEGVNIRMKVRIGMRARGGRRFRLFRW